MHHLLSFCIEQCSLAYCFLDKKRRLKKSGGNLAAYALTDFAPGDDMHECLPFLEGMIVRSGDVIMLPFVQVTPSTCAEVHILGTRTGLWIMFLDRTNEAERRRVFQQSVNEAKLLGERLSKVSRELQEARDKIASLQMAKGQTP